MTETPTQETPASDRLTDHSYDGIQEYDNPTPGWWTWLFVATVIFSVFYFVFVTLAGGGLSPEGFYQRALTEDLNQQFGALGELKPDAATIMDFVKNKEKEKWLKYGASLFAGKCVACHGADGQGSGSAPNLTDNVYINVKKVEDIADVIRNGRNSGAMPAHSFRQTQLVLLSSYVASLRGQNKPGAAPQGNPIPPWSDK